MRTSVYLLSILTILFNCTAIPNVLAQSGISVNDKYIVMLKDGASPTTLAKRLGIIRKRTFRHALNGFAATIHKSKLQKLIESNEVISIEPDVAVQALGQVVPTGVKRIGGLLADKAKINGIDERVDVDVAILDTGIDLQHQDLNIVKSISFISSNTTGSDDNGHGTHVAGTVGALDNSIGVVGVAPGARLWSVKVLDSAGSGSLSSIIAGVDYVTANADLIDVVNMSLGGQGSSYSLRSAIQKSIAKGVVYVVAAGNTNFEVYGGDLTFGTADDFFPSSYPEVMTVSALADTDGVSGGTGPASTQGADDTMANFSNYSLYKSNEHLVNSPGRSVDVAAPGVGIYSTYKGGGYATMSGTSMASPHAAGVVALLIAQSGRAYDTAGVYAIRQLLIDKASPASSWGPSDTDPTRSKFDFYREGLILATATNSSTTIPTNSAPTVKILSPANGSLFEQGSIITLTGNAQDLEDGDLSSTINWNSSINGYLGTSSSVSARLAIGTHTITSSVTDRNGKVSSTSISLTVNGSTNTPPQLSFTISPSTSITKGTLVTLSGKAQDQQDGDLSNKISWSSSLNGDLGIGANINSSTLGVGTHTITARVSDAGGLQASFSTNLSVTELANTPPSLLLTTGTTTLREGEALQSSASANDVEDGNITSKIVWRSLSSGAVLGYGGQLSAILPTGSHVIEAIVTDSNGAKTSKSFSVSVTAVIKTATLVVSTNKASYINREIAYITAKATDSNGAGVASATLLFEIVSPQGTITTSSLLSSSSGLATYQYKVSTRRGTGTYKIKVTVSKAGYNSTSTNATFAVQ